jgi:hypothetical protein
MQEATRVYSTPPTNTPAIDPTRRCFLTVAAGASVASVGTLAVAAMPAIGIPMAADLAVDPIYAAIERHRQTAAVWDAAVDVWSNFGDIDITAEQREQRDEIDDAVDDAWRPCEQAGIDLVNTAPTTHAGIIAAIAYIRIQMLDDGIYMPHTMEFEFNPGNEGDAKETMAWIDAFLSTIAHATAALAGVQS